MGNMTSLQQSVELGVQKPKSHFLDMITRPQDLKLLSKVQLQALVHEIRYRILEVVSKNGGHLGGPLGVVELSVALHYVFDSPTDKMVWDVGHQAYAHKILTGRNKLFHTIRSEGGLSGYCKITESEHDAFGAGHASTSISAALGMAVARDFQNKQHHVIAIIGDGALTGGLAYEALNNAGNLGKDLIVILNDNKMSIAPNTGAIAKYLSKTVTKPKYLEMRKKVQEMLAHLPAIGNSASKTAGDIEELLLALPNVGLLFRELGFRYYGPIDGNNLGETIIALRNIKQLHGPILLHAKTEKGNGYVHAINDNQNRLHGVSSFNIHDGKAEKKGDGNKSYSAVFAETLTHLAADDERIIAITAAMPDGTGLSHFAKALPERFFDVGIAEGHAVTFAAGLAIAGFRPVCAIYSTFLQRAYDHVIHDVAIQKLPVIFCLDRAGLVGDDGPTHMGPFDIGYLRHIPGMTILVPKDEEELRHMLATALTINGPVAIRYPRGNGKGVLTSATPKPIPLASAQTLMKGSDIIILGCGPVLYEAMIAARQFKTGKVGVINMRSIKPIDEKMIEECAKHAKSIITLEEASIINGLGSAVLEILCDKGIQKKVIRLGIPDKFIDQAKPDTQYEWCGIDAKSIARTIQTVL